MIFKYVRNEAARMKDDNLPPPPSSISPPPPPSLEKERGLSQVAEMAEVASEVVKGVHVAASIAAPAAVVVSGLVGGQLAAGLAVAGAAAAAVAGPIGMAVVVGAVVAAKAIEYGVKAKGPNKEGGATSLDQTKPDGKAVSMSKDRDKRLDQILDQKDKAEVNEITNILTGAGMRMMGSGVSGKLTPPSTPSMQAGIAAPKTDGKVTAPVAAA